MPGPIKVISYNVRGLSSPHKTGHLWQELRNHAADMVFLQETHFLKGATRIMPLYVFNQWFHAPSPIARERGVTITYRKTCPIIVISSQIDHKGCYIFVKTKWNGYCHTFAKKFKQPELNGHKMQIIEMANSPLLCFHKFIKQLKKGPKEREGKEREGGG